MTVEFEWVGNVGVARMNSGENRFNPTSLGALHAILGEIEARPEPSAFVLTGSDKFFSNGLDLDRFGTHPEELVPSVEQLAALLGRLLVLPAYCVGALNGHAFAGGGILSLAFDWRVMRSDRGYLCLNEIDLKMPFTEQLFAGMSAQVPRPSLVQAMLTGARYGAEEALALGLVNETASGDEVLERALARATAMADKGGSIMGSHKRNLFGDHARRAGWNPSSDTSNS